MSRLKAISTIGFLLLWVCPASVDAQDAPAPTNKPDAATAKKKDGASKPQSVTTDFLKQYNASPGGTAGTGGGNPNPNYQDPLATNRDDPNKYFSKRNSAPSTSPKKRRIPPKPEVMKALPPPPNRVRHDRRFVNGITAQSSLYNSGRESSMLREANSRDALAKAAAPSNAKSRAKRDTTGSKPSYSYRPNAGLAPRSK